MKLKWLFVAIIILLLLILLIIFTKLTIMINFSHSQDNDDLSLKLKIWFGLITYKKSIPLIKIDDDSPAVVYKTEEQIGAEGGLDSSSPEKEKEEKFTAQSLINMLHDAKELLHHVISMHKIVRSFLRKISIKKIVWHSVIGVGDAAMTGTLTGALWAVKGGIIAIISHYMRLKDMPQMSITPSFQRAFSQTQFSCMLQFRIGYAMMAGLKLVKYWKGGKPNFRTKKMSFLSKEKTRSV